MGSKGMGSRSRLQRIPSIVHGIFYRCRSRRFCHCSWLRFWFGLSFFACCFRQGTPGGRLARPLIRKKKDERDADVQGNRIRKADRLAKKYLSEARKNLGQKEVFYESLERALHNYLKAKLNIETSDFNKEKIQNLLTERNVEGTVTTDFISILENCELARYTPITQVTMQNDYDKAAKTISLIDKQSKQYESDYSLFGLLFQLGWNLSK